MGANLRPSGPPTRSQGPAAIRAFLIADIRGYSRVSDERGDEAAARMAERFLSIARERLGAHSETIIEVRGDEVLAVFDSPRQAVRAAVALQSTLAAEQSSEIPVGIGVGIDVGEAVPLGEGYRGRALNLAARLCARARPGEILVTQELVHLSGTVEELRFEDLGPVRLKGISRPVNVMTVTRSSAGEGPPIAARAGGGRLAFRLLGPLEVTEDGRPVPLGGPRQRLVLACLLLAANRVVPIEEVVDRVWDEGAPSAARATIQSYVSHLRSELGPDRIEGRAPGYLLHAETEELDMLEFERLLRRARRQLPVEPREAAVTLGQALELWRGSPLSDLAAAPSLAGEIARLQELRLGAVEDLFDARLGLGEQGEVLPDLERLTVEHPLRERLWAHLMLARYRAGRQADALEAYHRARELLAEELGVDPSPELQDLHGRILRQDPALQLTGRPLRAYRLLERIGEGAFGIVWRALDPEIGREVAVKQIHTHLADDASFVRRFEQEAQYIARLEHPHVVPLYDYWRDGSGAYLVMRWMRGGSLENAMAAGPIESEAALRVVDQVAAALSAAHRVHLVHQDIKPANVLLDEEGNAYLSDFGIAEDLTDWREFVPSSTLGYYSPEQLRGEEVTARSDIYGLGMIVQELLDDQLDLGPAAEDVISRATADDPESRYPDAREVAVALRDALGASLPRPSTRAAVELRNPYKGLRPFVEADTDDFFGREALVDGLIARLREPEAGSRFLAVVGPSGSGKSSVVRAGLVPALRKGALPGSESWFYLEILPGAHPLEELEAALLRIGVNPPPSLSEQLEQDEEGLARAVKRILPGDGAELLLVVDQLEEVFTLVEEEGVREQLLKSLVAAVEDPGSRLRVVATLRADFYDRPLSYPGMAELMRRRIETVLPLAPEELERAIAGPADRVGVVPERALVAEMVADVIDRPGALPLLQYALTELFERRRDGALTLEAYREIDGVSGALAQRAEELYGTLNEAERRAARQLFLRLVTPGEGTADTRRLVPRAELTSLELDRGAIEMVIDTFDRRRLLTSDRDPATRGPTVEVAHEALLRSWDRLRIWIDEARDDLRQHRRVATAAEEWEASGRDPSFLLRGSRLQQLEAWSASTTLALSRVEDECLTQSITHRDKEIADERARQDRERGLERRSVLRLRALVAVLAVLALVGGGLTLVAFAQRGHARQQSRRAQREARIAMARELAAAAVASLDEDAERSLYLALQAVQTTYQADGSVLQEAEQALHWALQARRPVVTIRESPGRMTVALSPDGRRLLVAHGLGSQADVYDAHTGKRLLSVEADGDQIVQVDYGPDGRLFATSSVGNGGYTRVWDAVTGKQVWNFHLPDEPPLCCFPKFSPDGRFLATPSFDGTTYLWDTRTGRQVNRFEGTGSVAFSPDGKRMWVAEHVVDWREPHGGRQALSLVGQKGVFPNASWSPDGRLIATLTAEAVVVWDARTRKQMYSIFPPIGSFAPGGSPIDFSPDSTRLATGMGNGTTIVWKLSSHGAKQGLTLVGHEARVGYVMFSSDGRSLVTGSPDGTAKVYDVSPSGEREWLTVPGFTGIAYSPDGRRLATASEDGPVTVYDATAGRSLLVLRGHTGWVKALDFSPDGSRLASAASDGTVRIWDTAFGTELVIMEEHAPDDPDTPAHIADVKFSPDGTTVATTSVFGSTRIWDAVTGKLLRTLQNADGEPALGRFSVDFSPDGTLLAGEDNGTTYVWRIDDGRIIARLKDPTAPNRVAFSPDGQHLATASNDGSIRLWDVRTGHQIRAVSPNLGQVFGLAFSSDGLRLASVSSDGTVRLWDGRTLEQTLIIDRQVLAAPPDPNDIGTATGSIAFSPDATRLAATGGDGTVRTYLLPMEELIRLARSRLTTT